MNRYTLGPFTVRRADRYNRLTHDVEELTGRPPQSVEEFIRSWRELFA